MFDRGIAIQLETVRVSRHPTLAGNGHMINSIARKAYELNVDFLYRVNDDTIFYGRWAATFSDVLRNMSLSVTTDNIVGVIGPTLRSRTSPNEKYLMHDFVHRTHMDIFSMEYYPVELFDDDNMMSRWMSRVYGVEKTFKTIHIEVDTGNNIFFQSKDLTLNSVIMNGRKSVNKWLRKHDVSTEVLDTEDVQNDIDHQIFTLIDARPMFPHLIVECNIDSGKFSERADFCSQTRMKYGVNLRKPKQKLSESQFATWKEYRCGEMFNIVVTEESSKRVKMSSKSRKKKNKSIVATTFRKFPIPDCLDHKPLDTLHPLVAILSGSTTRSETNPSNSTLSIFTIMLPSLIRSLDCGFRYLVVIGYDKGDTFYDSTKVFASFPIFFF